MPNQSSQKPLKEVYHGEIDYHLHYDSGDTSWTSDDGNGFNRESPSGPVEGLIEKLHEQGKLGNNKDYIVEIDITIKYTGKRIN